MSTDTTNTTPPPTLQQIERSMALIAMVLAMALGVKDKPAFDQLATIVADGLEGLEP